MTEVVNPGTGCPLCADLYCYGGACQEDLVPGDGVALYSASHPRWPWYKRLYQWFRPVRLSKASLEDITISLPEDPV